MREIKFRAWDKENKGFINGFNMFGFSAGQGAPTKFLQRFTDIWEIEDVIIQQYTGLKDKGGREIYDGDICKDNIGDIVQIVWSEKHQWGCKIIRGCTLSQGLVFPLWQWDGCEKNGNRVLRVIGNVVRHPELLEATK